MNFSHHSQVINYLIEKFKFQSYLEIGVNNPRDNFDLIKCKFKIGVDPNGAASFTGTSDEFFDTCFTENTYGNDGLLRFDIIFIDGLHHADQVKKDFENSLHCLNEGGIILLHDTNPADERYTHVPRDLPTGKRWNGNTYQFLFELAGINHLDYKTLNFDSNGLTVVKQKPGNIMLALKVNDEPYKFFDKERQYLTRLCTTEQFLEWI